MAKTAGGGIRAEVWSGRIVITITRMYISRRKCEWCLQWQKTPPVARAFARVVARAVARGVLGGC